MEPAIWTDEIGVVHTVKNPAAVVRALYDRWPCGLEEIEAAVDGWRRTARQFEAEQRLLKSEIELLRQRCAEQLAGVTDIGNREFIEQLSNELHQLR